MERREARGLNEAMASAMAFCINGSVTQFNSLRPSTCRPPNLAVVYSIAVLP